MKYIFTMVIVLLPFLLSAQFNEREKFEKEAKLFLKSDVEKSRKIYDYLIESELSKDKKITYQLDLIKVNFYQEKNQQAIDLLFQLENEISSVNKEVRNKFYVLKSDVFNYFGFRDEAALILKNCKGIEDKEIDFLRNDLLNLSTALSLKNISGNSVLINASEVDSLKEALSSTTNLFIRQKQLAILANYYTSIGNEEGILFYRNEQINNHDNYQNELKINRNYLINQLLKLRDSKQNKIKNQWIASSILLIFMCLILFIYKSYIKRRKKRTSAPTVLSISDKTELLILNKLIVFEQSIDFLNPSITLASLAKELETNVKYLSNILNQKKGKSFNNYINELRITYILNKLKNDHRYRSYKISYLATESGFISQSSFLTSFKLMTGTTPSAYIKELNDTLKVNGND